MGQQTMVGTRLWKFLEHAGEQPHAQEAAHGPSKAGKLEHVVVAMSNASLGDHVIGKDDNGNPITRKEALVRSERPVINIDSVMKWYSSRHAEPTGTPPSVDAFMVDEDDRPMLVEFKWGWFSSDKVRGKFFATLLMLGDQEFAGLTLDEARRCIRCLLVITPAEGYRNALEDELKTLSRPATEDDKRREAAKKVGQGLVGVFACSYEPVYSREFERRYG